MLYGHLFSSYEAREALNLVTRNLNCQEVVPMAPPLHYPCVCVLTFSVKLDWKAQMVANHI